MTFWLFIALYVLGAIIWATVVQPRLVSIVADGALGEDDPRTNKAREMQNEFSSWVAGFAHVVGGLLWPIWTGKLMLDAAVDVIPMTLTRIRTMRSERATRRIKRQIEALREQNEALATEIEFARQQGVLLRAQVLEYAIQKPLLAAKIEVLRELVAERDAAKR